MTNTYGRYYLAQQLSVLLPSMAAYSLAQQLADMQWRRSSKDRQVVQQNLGSVLGQEVPEYSSSVREVFRNFGRFVVEFFTMHRLASSAIRVDGLEALQEARRKNRGVIVLTGHLGNWELGAVMVHRLGYTIHAVALPHEDQATDRLFNRQRERCGVGVIPLGPEVVARCLAHLQAGHVLGLLGDREFMTNGLSVKFCEREVVMPRGPATLSMRSGAPILPSFLLREGPWKFRLIFERPIWPSDCSEQDSPVSELTQRYAQMLERYVRQFPTQWLMFQPYGEKAAWAVTA